MRTAVLLSALAGLVAASPVPQSIDFDQVSVSYLNQSLCRIRETDFTGFYYPHRRWTACRCCGSASQLQRSFCCYFSLHCGLDGPGFSQSKADSWCQRCLFNPTRWLWTSDPQPRHSRCLPSQPSLFCKYKLKLKENLTERLRILPTTPQRLKVMTCRSRICKALRR